MANSQQDWQELCVRGGCVCARVLLTVDERIILVTEQEQTLLEAQSPNGQIINLEMSYSPTLTIESTHVYKTNQSPIAQAHQIFPEPYVCRQLRKRSLPVVVPLSHSSNVEFLSFISQVKRSEIHFNTVQSASRSYLPDLA